MGKGKRNRERHLQNTLSGHAGKVKQANKSPVPKWLPSVIALAVVIAIMIPLVINAITGSGIIGRSRILIESETGKFDINQQMATFIAWEYLYESGLQYYQYYQYGLIQDSTGMFQYFSSADDYALTMAQSAIQNTLRDSIDDVAEMLKQYVAVCDLAHKEGYKLNEEDEEDVEEVITWLENMADQLGYSSLNGFFKVVIAEGLKKRDVEKISEMVVLYNKYVADKQLALDSLITLNDLTKYRDENPDSFYKVDYLTYATQNKDHSDKLAAAKTELEFKTAVAEIYFADNYKTIYNQYTTQKDAEMVLKLIKPLVDKDNDEDKALTNKLNSLSFDEVKTFKSNDETLDEDLAAYLFEKAKKYTSDSVATENGIYLVAPMSDITSTTEGKTTVKSVDVRLKFYPFVEGEEHEDDKDFKANLLKLFTEDNTDVEDDKKTETKYQTASEKVAALITALNATDADTAKIFDDNTFIKNVEINADTIKTDSLPQAIIDKVRADSAEAGKAFSVTDKDDSNKEYVVFINSITDDVRVVTYLAPETDLFCSIRTDLQTGLDKVFTGVKTQAYKKDAAENSFEAWLCEVTEGFTSARKDGETKVIDTTKDEVTTYNVYMSLINEDNGPDNVLYMDKTTVVKGGYLQFSDLEAANAALANLNSSMTGNELLEALSVIQSDKVVGSPSNSSAYKEESLKNINEDLAKWFFDNGRTQNEFTVISAKDEDDEDIYYIVVYIENTEAWNRSARNSLLNQQLTDWINALTAPYVINTKKLDKIGTASTTAATTAAA